MLKFAIENGYRHIDTAYSYGNEADVGQGIRDKIADGSVAREDLFIVTKLSNIHHGAEHVERACRLSLKNLGLDYVDLYLMHTPMGWKYIDDATTSPTDVNGETLTSDVDYLDTWKAMETLVEKGLTKSIGLSNFNSEQISRILSNCSIKPVTNQVECGPTIQQKKLIEFCKQKEIILTAYTPLGRMTAVSESGPKAAVDDERVIAIGKKYGKSPAQVVLRYLTQLGVVPIPKSANKTRILENISLFDFELNEDDVKVMESFNTGERYVPFLTARKHPHYPFNIEF